MAPSHSLKQCWLSISTLVKVQWKCLSFQVTAFVCYGAVWRFKYPRAYDQIFWMVWRLTVRAHTKNSTWTILSFCTESSWPFMVTFHVTCANVMDISYIVILINQAFHAKATYTWIYVYQYIMNDYETIYNIFSSIYSINRQIRVYLIRIEQRRFYKR